MFALLQSPKSTAVVALGTGGVGIESSMINLIPTYLSNVLIVLSIILAVISIVNGVLLSIKTISETKAIKQQALKNKQDK